MATLGFIGLWALPVLETNSARKAGASGLTQ
jgi:hypothetical protein